ncbi:MAG: YlmH/Sll1252 family protein [Candidatus Coprovivens sp.]
MKNIYNIEKIIDNLYSKGYTNFISPKELWEINRKLKKNTFNIYELYPESNKVILYDKQEPNISLLKIKNSTNLRHQDIMGVIFSLGLKEDTFGDIIKYKDEFYIFVLPSLKDFITYNITEIKSNTVEIEEVPIELSHNFAQEYIKKEIIVSSLRIDNVISTLIGTSRNEVLEKFKNKEIIYNYNEITKPTYQLNIGDTFSIRKYGKYKYNGILKNTKKGGFIIEILMYK